MGSARNTTKDRAAQALARKRWDAVEDKSAATAAGRAAFEASFADSPDPAAARRAHFREMAARSAQAKRRKAIEEYVDGLVALAPELAPEVRDRLALALRAPSGGAAA